MAGYPGSPNSNAFLFKTSFRAKIFFHAWAETWSSLNSTFSLLLLRSRHSRTAYVPEGAAKSACFRSTPRQTRANPPSRTLTPTLVASSFGMAANRVRNVSVALVSAIASFKLCTAAHFVASFVKICRTFDVSTTTTVTNACNM